MNEPEGEGFLKDKEGVLERGMGMGVGDWSRMWSIMCSRVARYRLSQQVDLSSRTSFFTAVKLTCTSYTESSSFHVLPSASMAGSV